MLTVGNLSSVPVMINQINIMQMPNVLTCCLWFQVEGTPKKHVAEEFEDFDYSDLYEDLSISTVTTSPNVTDYEVRLTISGCLSCSLRLLSFPVSSLTHKIIEYEDYDNTTDLAILNEYEYEEEEERYGPAEREREVLFNTQVTVQILLRGPFLFI